MKKWFSLAIAFLILLSASCGGGSTADTTAASSDTTTAAPETTVLTDGLEDKDMGGFSFNILHHDDTWLTWAKTQLIAEEENGDLINDAIYKRNMYIEDRFNAEINVTGIKQVASVIKQEILSGDNNYDIILQYGINVLGNIDLLADFNKIPHLNLEADHWNPEATSIFGVGDKQIAIAGNYTLSYASGSSCMIFNKQLYEDLQIKEDIYQLVRDGKWTTDKFFTIAAQGIADLNGDTKMDENDRAGATGSIKGFFNGLITGAGIKYVQMDENHHPYFDVKGNTKTVDFMEMMLDQLAKEPFVFATTNTGVDNGGGYDFANGQCFFNATSIYNIETKMRECEVDFGIIPQPKYDEKQEKYLSQTNIGEIATLPRSYDASRAENIGMLLEAMSFYSQQHIVPAYKEVVIQTKMTRDEESMEMLDYVFEGFSFDYGIVVWQNEIGNQFMKQIYLPRSNTIASTVESVSSALEVKIAELIAKVEEMP